MSSNLLVQRPVGKMFTKFSTTPATMSETYGNTFAAAFNRQRVASRPFLTPSAFECTASDASIPAASTPFSLSPPAAMSSSPEPVLATGTQAVNAPLLPVTSTALVVYTRPSTVRTLRVVCKLFLPTISSMVVGIRPLAPRIAFAVIAIPRALDMSTILITPASIPSPASVIGNPPPTALVPPIASTPPSAGNIPLVTAANLPAASMLVPATGPVARSLSLSETMAQRESKNFSGFFNHAPSVVSTPPSSVSSDETRTENEDWEDDEDEDWEDVEDEVEDQEKDEDSDSEPGTPLDSSPARRIGLCMGDYPVIEAESDEDEWQYGEAGEEVVDDESAVNTEGFDVINDDDDDDDADNSSHEHAADNCDDQEEPPSQIEVESIEQQESDIGPDTSVEAAASLLPAECRDNNLQAPQAGHASVQETSEAEAIYRESTMREAAEDEDSDDEGSKDEDSKDKISKEQDSEAFELLSSQLANFSISARDQDESKATESSNESDLSCGSSSNTSPSVSRLGSPLSDASFGSTPPTSPETTPSKVNFGFDEEEQSSLLPDAHFVQDSASTTKRQSSSFSASNSPSSDDSAVNETAQDHTSISQSFASTPADDELAAPALSSDESQPRHFERESLSGNDNRDADQNAESQQQFEQDDISNHGRHADVDDYIDEEVDSEEPEPEPEPSPPSFLDDIPHNEDSHEEIEGRHKAPAPAPEMPVAFDLKLNFPEDSASPPEVIYTPYKANDIGKSDHSAPLPLFVTAVDARNFDNHRKSIVASLNRFFRQQYDEFNVRAARPDVLLPFVEALVNITQFALTKYFTLAISHDTLVKHNAHLRGTFDAILRDHNEAFSRDATEKPLEAWYNLVDKSRALVDLDSRCQAIVTQFNSEQRDARLRVRDILEMCNALIVANNTLGAVHDECHMLLTAHNQANGFNLLPQVLNMSELVFELNARSDDAIRERTQLTRSIVDDYAKGMGDGRRFAPTVASVYEDEKRRIEEFKTEKRSASDLSTQLQQLVQDAEDRVDGLELHLSHLQPKYETRENELENLQSENRIVEDKVGELQRQLDAANATITAQRNQILRFGLKDRTGMSQYQCCRERAIAELTERGITEWSPSADWETIVENEIKRIRKEEGLGDWSVVDADEIVDVVMDG